MLTIPAKKLFLVTELKYPKSKNQDKIKIKKEIGKISKTSSMKK